MQLLAEADGKGVEIVFEIVRILGKGRKDGEQHGVGAVHHVLDHRREQVLLFAVVIVDRLARHAGFGGDLVDAGAGKTLAAEHFGGSFQDGFALGALSALAVHGHLGNCVTADFS